MEEILERLERIEMKLDRIEQGKREQEQGLGKRQTKEKIGFMGLNDDSLVIVLKFLVPYNCFELMQVNKRLHALFTFRKDLWQMCLEQRFGNLPFLKKIAGNPNFAVNVKAHYRSLLTIGNKAKSGKYWNFAGLEREIHARDNFVTEFKWKLEFEKDPHPDPERYNSDILREMDNSVIIRGTIWWWNLRKTMNGWQPERISGIYNRSTGELRCEGVEVGFDLGMDQYTFYLHQSGLMCTANNRLEYIKNRLEGIAPAAVQEDDGTVDEVVDWIVDYVRESSHRYLPFMRTDFSVPWSMFTDVNVD